MLRNIFSCLGLFLAVVAIIAGFIYYIWAYNDTVGKMDFWTFMAFTAGCIIFIGIKSLFSKER